MQRVNLSASASVQVPQDLLTMTLATVREGADAQTVQTQVKTALDSALNTAKADAKPGLMDVRTGRFALNPRYGRDGKLSGWQGTAELVLEGRDFAHIGTTAGKLVTLTVSSAQFGLTPDNLRQAQSQAQVQAIADFRQNASGIAKGFGFTDYTLGEVQVSADAPNTPMRPRMMAVSAMAMSADSAVPAEAGVSSVTVTVSGSVQLK